MNTAPIKTELRDIADHIPESASYGDVMYELYVRMKVKKGRQATEEGRIISHRDVKQKGLHARRLVDNRCIMFQWESASTPEFYCLDVEIMPRPD